ncbi:hypothetical protein K504DRAFT_420223 [Pleomassaria siparia CBS 279.74]|uniref:CENP-V/GFA domain-containing protein n=1 Tax=Pleomassaria siparia CBS 279.74 TaxID=1314801 RepID=A0A6G1KNI8_9PLEO|nr:hypothetical protein K504DRAFT_420223 [Pleomassaria siparia CBS 279.74]
MSLKSSNSDFIRTGACLCKQITFRVVGPELNFAICHCTNCRRNCGSAYTANAWFPDSQFEWTTGESLLKQHDDALTETGGVVHRFFCTNCGSAMMTRSFRMPGVSIIPSGLFDGPQVWKPDYEQWRRSKVNFVDRVNGVKNESRYDEFPDTREFERVWGKL